MRRFNPEKELNKIQKGNRTRVILFVISLLVVGVIGYSFALYQVRYSKGIIYTKVAPFSNKDIELAVYWGDTKSNKFPDRGSEYIYDYTKCDNDSVVEFNMAKWKLNVEASGPDKCDVHFKKVYKDASGANRPELYQGLIPVTFGDDGKVYVANLSDSWYDYDDHRWANAVLVDASNEEIKNKYFNEDGSLKEIELKSEISMNEILQMYVWIPRYKYQLFNAVNGESKPEQEIKIEFEKGVTSTGTVICETSTAGVEKCQNDINGNWYTHPAFRFGDTDLTGFWVGKFEPSGNNTNVKIIPNVTPILNQNVPYMFNATRYIEETYAAKFNINNEEIDTHMMKNMDWGAMAYLTQSKYGRCVNSVCTEVTHNNKYTTGYDNKGNLWNMGDGMLASTTGNMYGIYDTSGCGHEYVMGNMVNQSGAFYAGSAGNGFYVDKQNPSSSKPDSKYYDVYEYDANSRSTHARGHLGDATREILQKFGSVEYGGWYDDYAELPAANGPWFGRGAKAEDTAFAGVFAFGCNTGGAGSSRSFRIVLTAEDKA